MFGPVVSKQPYACYPTSFDPYTRPTYKVMAAFVPTARTNPRILRPNSGLCTEHCPVSQSAKSRASRATKSAKVSTNSSGHLLFQSPGNSSSNYPWLSSKRLVLHSRPRYPRKRETFHPIPKPDFETYRQTQADGSLTDRSLAYSSDLGTHDENTSQKNEPYEVIDEEVNKTGIPQKSLIKARPRSAFHIHEQDDEETAAQKIIAHCIHSSKHRPKSAPPKVEVADSDQTVRQIPAPSDKQKQHKAPQNKRSFRTDKMENLEEGAREVVERQISYERALKKYGWRMEVPGDPFNLKSRFIPERMSYVIPYELTPSLPQPPVMRVNNKDTFFHTTIKILPLSFTIDPDFKSEFFVARKKALMSSGKWPYASRRYAFAY